MYKTKWHDKELPEGKWLNEAGIAEMMAIKGWDRQKCIDCLSLIAEEQLPLTAKELAWAQKVAADFTANPEKYFPVK